MDYKTFISNTTATLSMAALVSMGSGGLNLATENISLTSASQNISTGIISGTYSDYAYEDNIDLEEIEAMIGFANKLLENNQPLDADVAQLINDNIMDLLS
ncbi:MAG: hypothetical protein GQ570_04430 [Helicobacteraceae bacterium]|nr:hypothetical protein [Helicobacteraceae bacterium]